MKTVRFQIPEYLIEVHFFEKRVEVYDLLTQRVFHVLKFEKQMKEFTKVKFNKFKAIEKATGDKYQITIDLVQRSTTVLTKAGYILDFFMSTPTHGYFFGLYQIGEFSLKENEKIILNKTINFEYGAVGWVLNDKIMYLSQRETSSLTESFNYYLVKIDWEFTPTILWRKSLHTTLTALFIVNNTAFLGLKDGVLEIWDLKQEKVITSKILFSNGIAYIKQGLNIIYCLSHIGEIAGLSIEGDVIWQRRLGDRVFYGLVENEKGIHLINEIGQYFCLDPTTGGIKRSQSWQGSFMRGIASNLIEIRGWLIGAGSYGIYSINLKENKKTFFGEFNDPLIRKLQHHPNGLISGDDDGRISFWKLGGIRVKKLY